MPTYIDIELAFEYVSGAPYGTNRVIYDKVADRFLYESDMSGESEIPDDIEWDTCVEVPHKHDLDLGQHLVFRFILQTIPDEEDAVCRIFKRPGAYGRFKNFLERRQLLQQWFDYETSAQRKAIEQWCKEYGIEIGQQGAGGYGSPEAGSPSPQR